MKKLVLLVVLVAILGVADVLARVHTEQQLELGVEDRLATDASGVDADISSFPFLGRLLVSGEVPRATIEVRELVGFDIPVASLRVDIEGLRIDRSTAFDSQRIQVTGIDRAVVVVQISRAELEEAFGSLAGVAFDVLDGASVSVGSDEISVGPLSVPFGAGDLLPCDASATVESDGIELACESDTLPPIIVDAIGSIDLREELGL